MPATSPHTAVCVLDNRGGRRRITDHGAPRWFCGGVRRSEETNARGDDSDQKTAHLVFSLFCGRAVPPPTHSAGSSQGSPRGEDDSFSVEIVGAWRMQWRFRMLWSFGCQHNADLPVGRLAVMWPSVLSQGRSVPLLVPSISEGSDRLGLGIDHALSHDCAPLLRCIFARSHRNGLMRCWRADSPRDRTWVRAELAP